MPIYNKYGRVAQNRDIREMLGLSLTAHLPANGVPLIYIQGWRVWVEPLKPLAPGKLHTSKPHRIRAMCPRCKLEVSAGRTGQHLCLDQLARYKKTGKVNKYR